MRERRACYHIPDPQPHGQILPFALGAVVRKNQDDAMTAATFSARYPSYETTRALDELRAAEYGRLDVASLLLLVGHRVRKHTIPTAGRPAPTAESSDSLIPPAASGSFGSRGPASPTASHAVPVDGARASLIR